MSRASITRVELHGATTSAKCEGLHGVMEKAGFLRTIAWSDGIRYHLPTATYYMRVKDEITPISLVDVIKPKVDSYWRLGSEVICSVGPVGWSGLPKV